MLFTYDGYQRMFRTIKEESNGALHQNQPPLDSNPGTRPKKKDRRKKQTDHVPSTIIETEEKFEDNVFEPKAIGPKIISLAKQDTKGKSTAENSRTYLNKVDEALIKGYLTPHSPGDAPLQIRRTLDQYFYTHLANTSQRDSDQVVYRYTRDRTPYEPKMFMVDQLWLWVLNDGTYFHRLLRLEFSVVRTTTVKIRFICNISTLESRGSMKRIK
ncbi:hypothetical protein NHQ30_010772 [Ciborinia camelliae]|nr:hypothetical protein NHQ30_010772 [Ciborinia camelliae]